MFQLLEGMKVLDLTRLLPGGYATMMLADLGAEVLKVEDPWEGDYIREIGPKHGVASVYYLSLCRNKKSMKLNLKEQEGREVLCRLVKNYNVLIESFRPGVMDKLGLGYEKLSAINPGLVYCSLSGYGQDGPYRFRPGHDLNYMALAGALGITGRPGSGPPPVLGIQVGDVAGGALMSTMGILASYINSKRTGKGQFVDVAMFDGLISLLTMFLTEYLNTGKEPVRGHDSLTGGHPCYNCYETKDGKFISLGALEPKFWKEFCRKAGLDHLISSQFSADSEVFQAVEDFFRSKDRDEIVEMYKDVDTCLEPVLAISEVMKHPHVVHRNMLQEMKAMEGGLTIRTVGHPLKLSGAVQKDDTPPPLHGQHTEEILHETGYAAAEIEALAAKGIIK